jgi:hypothetical protein
MTDTPSKTNTTSTRRPDCVTEIRMGNTVLTVSGYFKQDTTDTAADKMEKVLEAEGCCQQRPSARPSAGTSAIIPRFE